MRTIRFKHEPLLKRLPAPINTQFNILSYDVDNLYPQRQEELMKRSRTAKTATTKLCSFIAGKGFEDQRAAQLVINRKGHTLNNLLMNCISFQKGFCNGMTLHITYNLNYTIKEITPLKFKFVRIGLPDQYGNVTNYKYCTNWELDPMKSVSRNRVIYEYPRFNPDPAVIAQQVQAYGGPERYPGQVWYWSMDEDEYPLSVIDAVMDDAQAQSEVAVFRVSSIQNGFAASTLVKWPGTFENDEERAKVHRDLAALKGADAANSTVVVEFPAGATGEDFKFTESIQMPDTDKMYNNTNIDVRNAIRENFGQPAEIHGIMPEAGMFNKANIVEAFNYYNAETEQHRQQVTEELSKLLVHWWQPLALNLAIIPKAYV